MAYYEGEISPITANNGNNGNNWGGDWAWWIVILLIFGWGNGGFGGFGGNGGGANSPGLQGLATRADINEGFAMNGLQNGISGLRDGQMGIQQSLCQGFNGINTSILQSANGTERQLAQLGYQMQDCCCQTQRAIDGVNYNMATNACNIQNTINNSTRDIIDGQRASTDAILGFLTNEKIESLRSELTQAQAQLSQNAQTQNIINTLRPVASPAYITCSPYESVYGFNNRGCGCC